jgi:chitin synthase
LCFQKSAWLLKYVKPAKASTDVPDRLPEFISQRRRWLNGSLFAALYSLAHCGRLLTSGQPFLRKVMLIFQTLFSLVQMVFSLTAIANFFMALYFLFQSATSDPNSDPFGGQGEALLQVVLNVLLGVIVVVIIRKSDQAETRPTRVQVSRLSSVRSSC